MTLNDKAVYITYNKEQLKNAVQYVWEHNFRIRSEPLNFNNLEKLYNYVHNSLIVETVKRNVSNPTDWTSWVCTAGFLITFSTDDEDNIENVHVEIFVDPSIGSEMTTSFSQEVIVL